jgi:hypothetical protein
VADGVRRIVGEKVHARHQRVARDDEFLALGDHEDGSIVLQAERPHVLSERRKNALDDIELTLAFRITLLCLTGHGRSLPLQFLGSRLVRKLV